MYGSCPSLVELQVTKSRRILPEGNLARALGSINCCVLLGYVRSLIVSTPWEGFHRNLGAGIVFLAGQGSPITSADPHSCKSSRMSREKGSVGVWKK